MAPLVSPSPTPPACDGVLVTGDIQQAIDANPEGTIFCLSGTYGLSQPLRPKTGQSFVGPAIIVAQNGTTSAFTLKDAKAQGVTLVDLDVSGFSDSGIQLWVGTTVIRGRYHHNTTNGMGGGFEYALGAVTLDGVEVDHNGDAALLGISSGGIKIARLADLFLVQNCNIHDNLGNGVWADVQCIGNYRIINNTVSNNSRKGIHYEKSGASDEFQDWGVVCKGCGLPVVEGTHYVAGNTVTGNGWENRAHAADGGIVGVSSRNMVIENNTTSGNHRAGIMLYQDDRLAGEQHGWIVGATVRNNITPDGIIGCDLPGVTCS